MTYMYGPDVCNTSIFLVVLELLRSHAEYPS